MLTEPIEIPSAQYFDIDAQCLDRSGRETDRLIIDIDPAGIVGIFLKIGNPFTVSGKGAVIENTDILIAYLDFMANIDLSDEDGLEAIGFDAMSGARSLVMAFFHSMAGIETTTRCSDGKTTTFIDPDAKDRIRARIRHVANPEFGGQPWSEIKRMNFADVQEIISCVNISNMELKKSQDG